MRSEGYITWFLSVCLSVWDYSFCHCGQQNSDTNGFSATLIKVCITNVLEECCTMLVSGSDPTWDFPVMFGLHNVPSVHSFPFVKQDRVTCRRYMRTAYCQNGEQVSR